VNVVPETPESDHGETTEKPTPTPNATNSKLNAMDAVLPATMAFQLTAEWVSSIAEFHVSVVIGPSLLASEINSRLVTG
jgi:hypothetical protein